MFADVNVGCVPRLTAVLKAGSTDRGPDFCLKGPLIDRRLAASDPSRLACSVPQRGIFPYQS